MNHQCRHERLNRANVSWVKKAQKGELGSDSEGEGAENKFNDLMQSTEKIMVAGKGKTVFYIFKAMYVCFKSVISAMISFQIALSSRSPSSMSKEWLMQMLK